MRARATVKKSASRKAATRKAAPRKEGGNVVDLLEALQASVEAASKVRPPAEVEKGRRAPQWDWFTRRARQVSSR